MHHRYSGPVRKTGSELRRGVVSRRVGSCAAIAAAIGAYRDQDLIARAGRLGPGLCLRLWSAQEQHGQRSTDELDSRDLIYTIDQQSGTRFYKDQPGSGQRVWQSLEDLAAQPEVVGNRLVGIEPGAGLTRITKEEVIPTYGLDDHIYQRLLKERIVFLGSEVRDQNANAICAQMLLLAAEDPDKDIFLYINSPGGSITAGMAIYDTMKFIQPDVATVAMGMAASMGQFLLSSGTKGKRYSTPNARILMHQPSGGMGGTASDIRVQAELILSMKQRLAELTAEQTGQTLETILRDNDRDNWFDAQRGLEYGFFDHIASSAGSMTGGGGTMKDQD